MCIHIISPPFSLIYKETRVNSPQNVTRRISVPKYDFEHSCKRVHMMLTVGSHTFQFTRFQLEGLKSQNHYLCSLQHAL